MLRIYLYIDMLSDMWHDYYYFLPIILTLNSTNNLYHDQNETLKVRGGAQINL